MRLWLLAVSAGVLAVSATSVRNAPAARALQPDRLVFASLQGGQIQIESVNADGTGRRQLTTSPGASLSPFWSRDGRKIVFVSNRTGTWQIYVMDAGGAGQRALTQPPGDGLFPAWSPDGRHVLYVSRREDDEQITVMNADGSGRRMLTGPPGKNTVPVWSPDGTRIAFISTRDAVPELYVMNPDGSAQQRLTAPDVYVSNAYGRGEKHLEPVGVLLRPGMLHPVWSPDGSRIAFVFRVGRAEQQISAVELKTGTATRIATGYAPAWSPDGTRMAFVVARVGDAQIYAARADGSHAVRLTPSGINLLPAWSPDGRRIAFLGSRGPGGLGIYVMDADGSHVRRVGDAAGDLSMLPILAWQPR